MLYLVKAHLSYSVNYTVYLVDNTNDPGYFGKLLIPANVEQNNKNVHPCNLNSKRTFANAIYIYIYTAGLCGRKGAFEWYLQTKKKQWVHKIEKKKQL